MAGGGGGWRHCDVYISIVLFFLFICNVICKFCQSDITHFVGHVISNCNQNVREKYTKVTKYECESPSCYEVAK